MKRLLSRLGLRKKAGSYGFNNDLGRALDVLAEKEKRPPKELANE